MSATDGKPPIVAALPRWAKRVKTFDNIASKEFGRMIYASNNLEDTGLNFDDTVRLCELVFTDSYVPETYKEEKRLASQKRKREEEAHWKITKWATAALKHYFASSGGRDKVALHGNDDGENVEDERRKNKQSRREVIQHARAWKYFIQRFCIDQEELSTNLLQRTHSVLCAGIEPDDNGQEWWHWSGRYRDFDTIGAGTLHLKKENSKTPTSKHYKTTKEGRKPIMYIRATAVETYMDAMIEDFNILKGRWSSDGVMGYCNLAAWVGGRIMNIWPFKEENGKMARLVMNAVLWKYFGVVVGIGEGEGEKEEYLEILRKAGEVFHGEEFAILAEEQRGHEELTGLVSRKFEEGRKRIEESLKWKWKLWR
ncbi:hypothetical protein TWF281_009014 [Arthrobotrys megalospora]